VSFLAALAWTSFRYNHTDVQAFTTTISAMCYEFTMHEKLVKHICCKRSLTLKPIWRYQIAYTSAVPYLHINLQKNDKTAVLSFK